MDLEDYLYFEHKKNRKFTQKTFAKLIGVHSSCLSSYFTKPEYCFSMRTARRIEEVTGGQIKAYELLDAKYNPQKRKIYEYRNCRVLPKKNKPKEKD